MNDETKVLAVGTARMLLINDEDYKNLFKVRKFLEALPEYGKDNDLGYNLHEMADRLDNVYWLHTAYKKSYEENKNYSLKMQEMIAECNGFVTFKEYIAMSFRINNKTHTSQLNDMDLDVYIQIAHDKKFPDNKDVSWKSYRKIINYVIQNYSILYWCDIREMYNEYKAVIEGRWFP